LNVLISLRRYFSTTVLHLLKTMGGGGALENCCLQTRSLFILETPKLFNLFPDTFLLRGPGLGFGSDLASRCFQLGQDLFFL
jgi:hypothetical protein